MARRSRRVVEEEEAVSVGPLPSEFPPGQRVREVQGSWEGTIIEGAGIGPGTVMVLIDGTHLPVPHQRLGLIPIGD